MNSLISIVIPVYNTKQHILEKCITSILNQTYKNIEIILVDDGSTHDCSLFLDSLAEQYSSQISVFHQNNAGPSVARNTGLEHIKGSYFCLIDADDYISENYIEKLLCSAINTNSDIAIANMIIVDEKTNLEYDHVESKYECSLDMVGENKYRVLTQFFHRKSSELVLNNEPFKCSSNELWMHVMIWGRLYKTEPFKNIRFVSNVIFSEDNIFCLDTLKAAKRISFVKNTFYYYYANQESISHKYYKFDIERYVEYFDALSERLTDYPEIFAGKFTGMMLGLMKSRTSKKSFFQTYAETKKLLSHTGIRIHADKMNMEGCATKQERRTRFCLIHNLPFLMSVFILLGKIKSKIKCFIK